MLYNLVKAESLLKGNSVLRCETQHTLYFVHRVMSSIVGIFIAIFSFSVENSSLFQRRCTRWEGSSCTNSPNALFFMPTI